MARAKAAVEPLDRAIYARDPGAFDAEALRRGLREALLGAGAQVVLIRRDEPALSSSARPPEEAWPHFRGRWIHHVFQWDRMRTTSRLTPSSIT